MTDLASLQRLRDAATVLRAVHEPGDAPRHAAIFATVADWLADTARRAGYTQRNVDLDHAHRVADVILDGPPDPEPQRHAPLTDEPSGAHITAAGRDAVLDYHAIRQEQQPRPRLGGGPS